MLQNEKYKIIDNFLDKESFNNLKLFFLEEDTPWYQRKKDVPTNENNKNGFFQLCFYNNYRVDHNGFDNYIAPILNKLDCYAPVQVRANLVLRDPDTKESGWHTDFNHPEFGKTAIFYLTTCNAKTLLGIDENNLIHVNSIENRMLIFKSNIVHKVVYQTDVYKRFVINFNYI